MKALKFLLVTVFFALLVNSCNNPFNVVNTSEAGKLPAGKGSLYLKIAGNERTIMPAAFNNEHLYYELVFTSKLDGKKKTVSPVVFEEPVLLDVGVYSLVVNAYANEDQQLLFSGTVDNIVIQENAAATAVVNLRPVNTGGTGTFSWDITFPDDVSSAVMKITKRDGGTLVGSITLNNNEKTGARNLPSGFYDVTITMTGNNPDYGNITVTRKEILHIYNGRVSEYENNFTDINFKIVYTVELLNAEGNYIPIYVIHGDTIPGDYFDEEFLTEEGYKFQPDAFLYEGAGPDKPGFVLEAWRLADTSDVDKKWNDDTPVTDDLRLYPDWIKNFENFGFTNIVNFINDPTTSGSYTLFIVADEVTLGTSSDEQLLTINSGVNLTIKSAGAAAKTINRGFQDIDANSGLLVVQGELTLENVIIDGQKESYGYNKAPLVRINGGTFIMNDDAVLQNNIARSGNGGGVVVNTGTFNMTGGTITGNSVTDNAGGGVVVGSGQFTMTGGTIGNINGGEGNTATTGGGVNIGPNGTFTMTGGTISGNTATSSSGGGGGVFNSGTLVLGGEAVIKGNYNSDNVLLASGTYIRIGTPPLEAPAEIWVKIASTTNYVIVNTGATSGDARYFRSDEDGKVVVFVETSGDGQLVLKDGTSISTAQDLVNLATLVNNSTTDITTGKYYILTNDITLTNWSTPIGTDSSTAFTGTFDGNGYTINFGTIDLPLTSDVPSYGLFGYIGDGGKVKNLNLAGSITSTLDSGDLQIGTVAAAVDEYGSIENVSSSVHINVTLRNGAPGGGAGGVVGMNSGTVQNCYTTGNITTVVEGYPDFDPVSAVGGVVGMNVGKVQDCYSTGNITTASGDSCMAGGVLGANVGTVLNCYATGNVKGNDDAFVGGIVGMTYPGSSITNCVAFGGLIVGQGNTTNYGRIAGYYVEVPLPDEGPLSNNYGLYQMKLSFISDSGVPTGNPENISTGTGNDENGANVYRSTDTDDPKYTNTTFWLNTPDGVGWSSDIWNIADNAYPTLKNMPQGTQ